MSQTKFDELKETIRTLIQQDLDEASVTGNIDGGEGPPKTPFAFRGKRKKDKKKKESIANQSGYSITEAAKFAVFFKLGKDGQFGTASILIDAGSKGEAKMKVAKMLKGGQKAISSVRRINVGKAKQIDKKLESVNESSYHKRQITDFIKKNKDMATGFTPTIQLKGANSKTNHLNISFGALEQLAKIMMKESINEADESALKAKMAKQMDTVKKHRESMKKHSGKDVKKANAARDRMKAAQAKVDDTQDKIIGIKKESVNEGRYHDYRNDETMTPKQKIGRSMMEVRDTLKNLENIVGMNIRLKNEIGVDSTSYWKRTHGAMKKISERLVKLANKVGQLH